MSVRIRFIFGTKGVADPGRFSGRRKLGRYPRKLGEDAVIGAHVMGGLVQCYLERLRQNHAVLAIHVHKRRGCTHKRGGAGMEVIAALLQFLFQSSSISVVNESDVGRKIW